MSGHDQRRRGQSRNSQSQQRPAQRPPAPPHHDPRYPARGYQPQPQGFYQQHMQQGHQQPYYPPPPYVRTGGQVPHQASNLHNIFEPTAYATASSPNQAAASSTRSVPGDRESCSNPGWSVSIGDLLQAMQIEPGWTSNCEQRAWNFRTTRSNRELKRVDDTVETGRFRQWFCQDGAQTLLIREPNSDGPEEIEAGEFSTLSQHAAIVCKDVIRERGAVALTFFCGSYRNACGTSEFVHRNVLRAFCHQLLSIANPRSDASKFCASSGDLEKIKQGKSEYLVQLFEDLVTEFSGCYRAHRTLVCCIDGVNVMEDAKTGYKIFQKMFEPFERLSAMARAKKTFNFKVLLTLPQQSSEDWERPDHGRIVVVNLPPKNIRT